YEKLFDSNVLDTNNPKPWYVSEHAFNTGGARPYDNPDFDGVTGDGELAPTEGIGTGWFYSAIGGGLELRPTTAGQRLPVDFDNTLKGGDVLAVPTVFNGNFDATERPVKGRFPYLFYEIPGWSYHNGVPIRTFNFDAFHLEEVTPGDPENRAL